jgi:hypothetical protein
LAFECRIGRKGGWGLRGKPVTFTQSFPDSDLKVCELIELVLTLYASGENVQRGRSYFLGRVDHFFVLFEGPIRACYVDFTFSR